MVRNSVPAVFEAIRPIATVHNFSALPTLGGVLVRNLDPPLVDAVSRSANKEPLISGIVRPTSPFHSYLGPLRPDSHYED